MMTHRRTSRLPHRNAALGIAALLPLLLSFAGPARAETPLRAVRVASGLSLPLFVTAPPGDTSRVFIVEQRGGDQRGRIKILRNGTILPTAFLTTAPLSTSSEQGLLGLAFAPNYATSGRFFIYYTDAGGTIRVARHTVSADPDVANAAGTVILSIFHPFTNHNGGWMSFGPDGFLYLATGDGGSAGDPGDRAQNVDSLLGKMLRLDVSGATYSIPPGNPYAGATPGRDEIWAIGLRNPWRPSFDRLKGDLIIADVGQNVREEVNFTAAGTGAGANYGWRCFEGSLPFTSSATTPCGTCAAPGCTVFPVHEYDHSLGKCSVTGGYVYRGCAIPDLAGQYFFADYCSRQIWSGRFQGGAFVGLRERTAELAPGGGLSIGNITSFGEDGRGELYITDQSGQVFKIVPSAPVAESDMPALRARTAPGDTLGSSTPGNVLVTGVTAFADAGSRIRGVGFIKDAQLRGDCVEISGNCLRSRMRLGTFDIDLRACVDSAAATLTREFVFKNISGSSQPLAYVDVTTPRLRNEVNSAIMTSTGGGAMTPELVQAASFSPDRWILHSGTGSAGVTTSADADTASQLAARIAADQPLAGGTAAGPGTVGMALGFDFGVVAPAAPETVVVVTKVQTSGPSGVELGEDLPTRSGLRILSRVPFRTDLRLEMALARAGRASLDVFDLAGRRVRALTSGTRPAGKIFVGWDGRLETGGEAPSGIYFVKLRTEDESVMKRVVLLR